MLQRSTYWLSLGPLQALSCMSRAARKHSAKSSEQSRPSSVLGLQNPYQLKRRSRSGAGTWRYSPWAPTAAYVATPLLISVGCLPITRSQDGSRAILFSANCRSARRNEHHSVLLSAMRSVAKLHAPPAGIQDAEH